METVNSRIKEVMFRHEVTRGKLAREITRWYPQKEYRKVTKKSILEYFSVELEGKIEESVLEALKRLVPTINLHWIRFGTGHMYEQLSIVNEKQQTVKNMEFGDERAGV